jgi:hypothetical protein
LVRKRPKLASHQMDHPVLKEINLSGENNLLYSRTIARRTIASQGLLFGS